VTVNLNSLYTPSVSTFGITGHISVHCVLLFNEAKGYYSGNSHTAPSATKRTTTALDVLYLQTIRSTFIPIRDCIKSRKSYGTKVQNLENESNIALPFY
jgi:hypothetical protein